MAAVRYLTNKTEAYPPIREEETEEKYKSKCTL